ILATGHTLSWRLRKIVSRGAASIEVFTLLRKPEALTVPINPRYVGFDIPNVFVVGYGLDYDERYRNLRQVAVLDPRVYGG
ncbi:MAG: hypoxanthine phosphoribosyltransferase, partial [Candidatus Nanopelagicales bacterium]